MIEIFSTVVTTGILFQTVCNFSQCLLNQCSAALCRNEFCSTVFNKFVRYFSILHNSHVQYFSYIHNGCALLNK